MAVRRQNSPDTPGSKPPRPRRGRTVIGARTPVRVVKREPRSPLPPPPKRATFDIAAPRIVLNPWRTKRDWRTSRPKFLAALLFAGCLVGLYALFNFDLFFVGEPLVVGNKIVSREEIQKVSGVTGWNIFFVEPHAVETVVRKLPEFKDVQVYVTLPNTVEIYTTERQPRFIWEVAGKNYWVDEEGIAMRPRGKVQNGWQVRDAEAKAVQFGERINPDAFNAVVALVNVWKNSPKYFEWTKAHGLTLRDEHGWLIYFGSANQMNDKVTALGIVTNQLVRDKRTIAFIDLGSGLPYYQEIAVKSK